MLICTRNREASITSLLNSLMNSSEKPSQVVIVASGKDITGIIEIFKKNLPITYLHTMEIGQSFQKKIGISLLKPSIDWVMLLDDDLLVTKSTIKIARESITDLDVNLLAGIGMRIIDPGTKTKIRIIIKQLFTYRLGKISKLGIPTHYMGSKKMKTEWLNGASIWKLSALKKYDMPLLNSKHAALEDAIFSTSIGQSKNLIYVPEIVVSQQQNLSLNLYSLDRFKYMTLWNTYFVCINTSANLYLYKLLTIQRLFKYLLFGRHINPKVMRQYSNVVLQILFFSNRKDTCKIQVLAVLESEIQNDNK